MTLTDYIPFDVGTTVYILKDLKLYKAVIAKIFYSVEKVEVKNRVHTSITVQYFCMDKTGSSFLPIKAHDFISLYANRVRHYLKCVLADMVKHVSGDPDQEFIEYNQDEVNYDTNEENK